MELTGAVILMTELGDITRFGSPRKLMSSLGLTPSEYSSGKRRRQGGITKEGNSHARRALVEGAWAYRYPAKVSRHLQVRSAKVPAEVQATGRYDGTSSSRTPRPSPRALRASATRRRNSGWCSSR